MQRVFFLSLLFASISLSAGTFSEPSKVELSEAIVKKLKKFHESSHEVDISKLKQKGRCFFARADTNSHTSFFSFELDDNTKQTFCASRRGQSRKLALF